MVGAQGHVKVAKKSSIYDITYKKHAPPTKIFFQVQTTRQRLKRLSKSCKLQDKG